MNGTTTVILSTGSTYVIDRVQGELVKLAIANGKDHISIRGSLIKVSSIMEVRDNPGGAVDSNQLRLAGPTTELTDEERKKNLDRWAEVRAKFFSRKRDADTTT